MPPIFSVVVIAILVSLINTNDVVTLIDWQRYSRCSNTRMVLPTIQNPLGSNTQNSKMNHELVRHINTKDKLQKRYANIKKTQFGNNSEKPYNHRKKKIEGAHIQQSDIHIDAAESNPR